MLYVMIGTVIVAAIVVSFFFLFYYPTLMTSYDPLSHNANSRDTIPIRPATNQAVCPRISGVRKRHNWGYRSRIRIG